MANKPILITTAEQLHEIFGKPEGFPSNYIPELNTTHTRLHWERIRMWLEMITIDRELQQLARPSVRVVQLDTSTIAGKPWARGCRSNARDAIAPHTDQLQ